MIVTMSDMIYGVSDGLDYVEKDLLGATTNHGRRIAYVSMLMGEKLGIPSDRLCDLACCAALHDNALSEFALYERATNERVRMKNLAAHCKLGERNISAMPFKGDVTGWVLYHHENADGSGGFGKTAAETPLGAQIIHAADSVDVRYPFSGMDAQLLEIVERYVEENTGTLYTQEVAQALLETLREMDFGALHGDNIRKVVFEKMPCSQVEICNEKIMELADVFSRIIDYKSHFTQTHSRGIADKTLKMMQYYAYDKDTQAKAYLAAALHDVGKLTIPLEVLEKPGKLTDEEFRVIQGHVFQSYEMLRRVRGFEQITAWATDHHEKLDGSGYWFGKTGEQMDKISRLLGCVDIYQAVREERPYHPANDHKYAMNVLLDLADKGKMDADIIHDMNTVLADSTA